MAINSFTLGMLTFNLGRRHLQKFLLCFHENRVWHFIQIVSRGDNLNEMSSSVSKQKWEEYHSLTSACVALRMLKVKKWVFYPLSQRVLYESYNSEVQTGPAKILPKHLPLQQMFIFTLIHQFSMNVRLQPNQWAVISIQHASHLLINYFLPSLQMANQTISHDTPLFMAIFACTSVVQFVQEFSN